MYLNEEKQCCSLTILTGIHADGINVCEVGHWRLHGSTGRPHVVEEEDGHSREAKHTEPCHTQDVCEEHKLKTQECHSVIKPFLKCALFKKKKVWYLHTIPLMHRPQMVVLNSLCSSLTALVV